MPSHDINLTEHSNTHLDDDAAKLEALRAAVLKGKDAYKRGEFVTMQSEAEIDSFFDEIDGEVGQSF